MRLPEIIFWLEMFTSPDPEAGKNPSRLIFKLPFPSGTSEIEPSDLSEAIIEILLPSRENRPEVDFSRGLSAAIKSCPFLSIKGIVEVLAGDCGGNPCRVSLFKEYPTEA